MKNLYMHLALCLVIPALASGLMYVVTRSSSASVGASVASLILTDAFLRKKNSSDK